MARILIIVSIMALIGSVQQLSNFDVLNQFTSTKTISKTKLDLALSAQCMSPFPSKLWNQQKNKQDYTDKELQDMTFANSGDMKEEDYSKESIYSILYSIYNQMGTVVSDKGKEYQFTFNTWGIQNESTKIAMDDPQRFGKLSYAAGIDHSKVQEYIKQNGDKLKIIEIGSGTGAGANLLTKEYLKNAKYSAQDMNFSGVSTCKALHEPNNKNLECKYIKDGAGINNNKLPEKDNSADFVIILETHIAATDVGTEEINIINEIKRILKPNGLLLWGNILPDNVWTKLMSHLHSNGFDDCGIVDNTLKGIKARDDDVGRVNKLVKEMLDTYYAFKLPYFGSRCRDVTEMLIKNFYRHPGTSLYRRMIKRVDTYKHTCSQLKKK